MTRTVRTVAWTADHVAGIPRADAGDAARVITPDDVRRIAPDVDVWDLGPVRTPDGDVAQLDGVQLWIAIGAPAVGHPGTRHDLARLRLLSRRGAAWRDLGVLFPDGASPGSREWAAGGVLHDGTLDVLYTAVGGAGRPPFDQRIVQTCAPLEAAPQGARWGPWSPHREVLSADGVVYRPADDPDGAPGFIKAFRDPFRVRDTDGTPTLLFTGSVGASAFNGAVGIARSDGAGGWTAEDPLITAADVNNELERPHVVRRDGRWYLFFSTQARTFAPGVWGPNGLYGFVADHLRGPYRPLNGTGLVMRNPAAEPFQAYSWFVLPDLTTVAFVDSFHLEGRHPEDLDDEGDAAARAHFGGTAAPVEALWVDGDRAGPVAPPHTHG